MLIDEDFFQSDEFRENLKAYEESVRSGLPIFMDADDLTDIIDYYNLMHMDKEADRTADYALSLFPGASGPITFKVRRYIDNNELDRADQLAECVSDKDIDYRYIKAEISLARNNPDEADRLFEEVMEIADEEELDNCILDAANIFFDYAYFELANKWIRKVEDKSTDDYIELKLKTLSSLGEIEKVEKILNNLIDRNPFEHKYWNLLSCGQLMNDKVNEALTSSDYSLAVTPDNPSGLLCKAQALCKKFMYDEAVKYYLKYSDIYPKDINSYIQLGYCYMNMSDNLMAIKYYKIAEDLAINSPDMLLSIYENLALAYSHINDFDSALMYINKLEAQTDDSEKLQVQLLKAYAFMEKHMYALGMKSLSSLLEESGFSPVFVLKASVVLYENHFEEMAYKLMHDYYPLNDSSTIFGYSYYALFCYDLDKEEEFLKYLKIATEINPEEAELALHHIFPVDMRASEYYDYYLKNIRNERK
ncbi:MAG: tetratricopeptide repeat protein [Prevotella sp.]